MDFDHLITFLEIAKQGSFSRAGQKLYRSQPAVSAQIRQLEQEYGQKLFDRVGKSVRLTVAGETLLEYAGRLLTLRNESLRAVADQASHAARHARHRRERGHLPLRAAGYFRGVQPAISGRADQHLPEFQPQGAGKSGRRHGGRGHRDDAGEIAQPEGPLDFPRPADADGQPDESACVVQDVRTSDIAEQPLIFPKTGFMRQVLDKQFRPYRSRMRITMELPSVGMIKGFVAAGLGVSLISERFARDEVAPAR